MVRFEKFKIWHAEDFDPDLVKVTETSHDIKKMLRDVTSARALSMTRASIVVIDSFVATHLTSRTHGVTHE